MTGAARPAVTAETDGDVPAARRATLEFGLRHEEAVLAWFDSLPGLLGR